MEILQYPHPFLFQKTAPVTVFGKELGIILDSMWETMIQNNGVGLSGNQVGLPFSIFVMKGPNGRLDIINPQIISKSLSLTAQKEGCLSAIGEFILIYRHSWVKLEYQDRDGNKKDVVLKDIYSVCAQHECEHLEGKSFLQNEALPRFERKLLAKKWGLK